MSVVPAPIYRLADKVTIVTGASSGLGRAIALAFAAHGARLVLCADLGAHPRGTFGAEEATVPTHELVCKRFGEGKTKFVETDVTVGTEVRNLVQEAVRLGGRLDVIANNAGVGGRETSGAIHEMEEDAWDFVM
ncbi:hypothetical protein MMC14_002173 [Varicellaria rhodocarpa]|nr:hypothetical protein [Varicellaria rhodocarpa]